MNANDPEFYQASKFDPVHIDQPRSRGCFFYGCVFAGVGMLLVMLLCGVGGFFAYRSMSDLVAQYTGTAPRPLPKVEIPPEKQAELKDRVNAFRKALDTGEETKPLVLSSDDVNTLIQENADFKERIYITLEGDKIKGQVSLPLDKIGENLPIFGRLLLGRYLNGEAELKVSLHDETPIVHIDSLEVNGQQMPEQMMTELRRENLAKNATRDRKNAEMISKLESVEVKDGKLIIKAHSKARRDSAKEDAEKSKTSSEDAPGQTRPGEPPGIPDQPFAPEPAKPEESPAKKAG